MYLIAPFRVIPKQDSPILEIILAKCFVVCRLLAAYEAAKAYPLSRNRETSGILWRDVDEVSSSPSLRTSWIEGVHDKKSQTWPALVVTRYGK